MEKLIVLLDNGHGENTPGKRSPKWKDTLQIFEWEYTRRLVKEIECKLKSLGFKVYIITHEKVDISLSERTKRIRNIEKQEGKDNCIVISVHLNAFDNSASPNGWEAHTYLGKSKSDEYSRIFYKHAENILKNISIRKGGPDNDPDYDSNFAILRDVASPAILTENLFMTNFKDCVYLNSLEGFNNIIKLHIDAIKEINTLLR